MTKTKDISGIRSGKLVAISPTDKKYQHQTIWHCKCDCGNTKDVPISLLTSEHTISCGCLQYQKGNLGYSWRGHGDISSRKWTQYRSNALSRNIPFEISIEQAWELYLSQGGKCALSGEAIDFPVCSKGGGTASLDRIDSRFGYAIENVHWVHRIVNSMKWDLPLTTFVYLCRLVTHPIIDSIPSDDCCEFKKHPHWRGYGNICGQLWRRTILGANERNIPLSITIEEAWGRFIAQNGRCAITGLPLSFNRKGTPKSYKEDLTASLDRVDSLGGYSGNNIQWVHKNINRALKRDLSEPELRLWSKRISDHENY